MYNGNRGNIKKRVMFFNGFYPADALNISECKHLNTVFTS